MARDPQDQPDAQALQAEALTYPDLPYVAGGHERQRLDLYLPGRGRSYPLIIWIHGGAFRMGSKAEHVPLHYLSLGYAVASIGYRLSMDAIFPAQIEDCKAAVRWLRRNAGRYDLDPQRFAAWGESAGGNLAALLGTIGNASMFDVGDHLAFPSRVEAVVDYFGPTDFLQMDAHRPPGSQVLHNTPDSPESMLVGGPIMEMRDQVARANPITYVTPGAPPFLIVRDAVHGQGSRSWQIHRSPGLQADQGVSLDPLTDGTLKRPFAYGHPPTI